MAEQTNDLASRLAEVRKMVIVDGSELSARALSLTAGLSASHVTAIEVGSVPRPGMVTIERLAATLGITTDWLISGSGKPPRRKAVQMAFEQAVRTRGGAGSGARA